MIRLAWRQLRLPALVSTALIAVVAIAMLVTHNQMSGYADSSGLTGCLLANGDCAVGVSDFGFRYSIWLAIFGLLAFLPILAGLFLGAPLVAREFEQGTHRLVWTQSISRGRWLYTKLAMIIGGVVVIGAAATIAFTLWARIWSTVDLGSYGRIQPAMFALQGTVLVASQLAAFAVGLAASAFIRRTLPAMVVTLASFVALTLGLRLAAPLLVRAKTVSFTFGTYSPRRGLGDWLLRQDLVGPTGQSINQATLQTVCPATAAGGGLRGIDPACAVSHGYHFVNAYEPLSAFWRLQLVETGILLGLAVVLIVAASWKITRHTS